MKPTFLNSPKSISLIAKAIKGAADRQLLVPGFDQNALSASSELYIGAGGLISHIALWRARKGAGHMIFLDADHVEASNLNRQLFYQRDLGKNKAIALAKNLQGQCTAETRLEAHGVSFEEALEQGLDLSCKVAVCGVDNNPCRIAASRYFYSRKIPIIFTAVSADTDHGYVFVQQPEAACFGCLFPDALSDEFYPCPNTPAITDILQAVGAVASYAIDTCLMSRRRVWNYRQVFLSDGRFDSTQTIACRPNCGICGRPFERRTVPAYGTEKTEWR